MTGRTIEVAGDDELAEVVGRWFGEKGEEDLDSRMTELLEHLGDRIDNLSPIAYSIGQIQEMDSARRFAHIKDLPEARAALAARLIAEAEKIGSGGDLSSRLIELSGHLEDRVEIQSHQHHLLIRIEELTSIRDGLVRKILEAAEDLAGG